jgi:hypothetical protein
MGHARRAAASLGWRGMLAVIRGAASLAGLGLVSCALYGPTPPYGTPSECNTDADCQAKHGNGWYCEGHMSCEFPPDAGTPDAGK